MTNTHEPTYTHDTYDRAGWYRHNVEPTVTFAEKEIREGGYAGTMVVPVLTAPVEESQRRDLVETVRRACPGIGAVRGLAAARHLKALRSLPETVAAREAVSLIPSDGTVPDHASAPDDWSARQHDVIVKRGRKGNQTLERKRVGVAPVRGDVDAIAYNGHADGLTDDAALRRSLATLELKSAHVADDHTGHTVYGVRRLKSGACVSFDVLRVANRHYPPDVGVPRLIGTDVTDWHEMRETPTGIDPREGSYVAESHAGISGWLHVSTLDSLASPESVYGTHTHTLKQAEPRMTLTRGRKRAGDPTDARTFVVTSDGEITSRWSLVAPTERPIVHEEITHVVTRRPRVIAPRHANRALPARVFHVRDSLTYAPRSNAGMEHEALYGRPITDQPNYRYVGHTIVTRPVGATRKARAEASKRANVKRDARTIGAVDCSSLTSAGIGELLVNLNRGERVSLKLSDGTRAVTRAASGLYACQYTRDDGKRGTYRTRSAETMATFVA